MLGPSPRRAGSSAQGRDWAASAGQLSGHGRNQLLHPITAATALLKCIKQPEAKTPINSSVKAEMFFSNGSLNTNNHSSLMCT